MDDHGRSSASGDGSASQPKTSSDHSAAEPTINVSKKRDDSHDAKPNKNTASASICPTDKASLIISQVDYYFSDANLQTDSFLRRSMKDSQNRPIPLQTIANFKKMQPFLPIEHIYDALKQSEQVNVFIGNSTQMCVQRKEPFHKQAKKASVAGPTLKKAKHASGFEEYYADPPTTPDAAREEQKLYSQEVSFGERLETAVKRYKIRRKMDSFTSNVFLKWMSFGGMYIGSAAFQSGVDPEELENMTAKQKKEVNTHTYAYGIDSDEHGEPLWEVDFVRVAKAFLSRRIIDFLDIDTEADLRKATNIMQNFYRYLQLHDVCPEYNEELQICKGVCQLAEKELPNIFTLHRRLPGNYNVAASTLFGGQWASLYGGNQSWTPKVEWKTDKDNFGMAHNQARDYFTIATLAVRPKSADRQRAVLLPRQHVVCTWEGIGLEVIRINEPTATMREYFDESVSSLYGLDKDTPRSPLGFLLCKQWDFPDFAQNDLPRGTKLHADAPERIHLLIEEDLLNCFVVGTKMRVTVHKLDSELLFFDEVLEIRPTFDTLIYNELTVGHKEPHFYTKAELREMDGKRNDEPAADGDAGGDGDEDSDGALSD